MTIAIVTVAAAFFWLLSRSVKQWEPLFSVVGGILLVMGVGSLLAEMFRKREKAPSFDTRHAVIVVAPDVVSYLTGTSAVNIDATAVERVSSDNYGLTISFGAEANWWIPLSAFGSPEKMAEEAKRIEATLSAIYVPEIDQPDGDSETLPRSLH